jgi:hypothetical protein
LFSQHHRQAVGYDDEPGFRATANAAAMGRHRTHLPYSKLRL